MSKQSKTSRRKARRQQAKQRHRQWLALGIFAIFADIVLYFTWQETGRGTSLDPQQVPDPVLGPETALVEIVEFADFGCPSCRAWHAQGIRDAVLQHFGEQVRFVWKDFPVITTQSPRAAEAAHCAGAQGKFWEYHDTVYEQFAGLDSTALQRYATQIGLDREVFDSCLERGEMRQKVQANLQLARQLGLRGTPGFTVNGRVLPAPPSFEQLADLIEQELSTQSVG